jgi:Domain of unknown function (DUF4349)
MSANELTVEALLRSHAPHAPESLRERVFALEPAPRRSSLPSRRLVLVALPAVVGVAVSVAVVHGILGSGASKPTALAPRHAAAAVTTPAWAAAGATATPATSGTPATPLSGQALAAPPLDARASKSFAPATSGRLQHTDASVQIRVQTGDELAQATTGATRIATSLGGYAKSVNYRSQGTSVLDLRVPTQNVKTALARLAGLGTLVSQELSVTDLQQRLQTQADQIAQLQRRIAALRAAVRDPALAEAQKVLLRIRLAESRRALSQRTHAQRGTIAAGTTSRIALEIGTKKAIAPVPPPRGRVGRMLHSAIGFLALEAIIALYALIVISPFAIVAALLWFWRRRSVDRLLAA